MMMSFKVASQATLFVLLNCIVGRSVVAFTSVSPPRLTTNIRLSSRLSASRKVQVLERPSTFHGTSLENKMNLKFDNVVTFDPLNLAQDDEDNLNHVRSADYLQKRAIATTSAIAATTALIPIKEAVAAASPYLSEQMNPANFQPVCPTSDGFYRFLQGSTQALVGAENFQEYSPLIAGGLLRIRLELCVVESFFNEAVGPFIKQNGISWILPLHETVETFLAGVIFSLASTFILVGSTKIVAVIITYADVFLGGPFRLFGGFFFDRARGKPVTLDIGFGPFKTRIVGPPDEVKEAGDASSDKLIDFENTDPLALAVILSSGAVKLVGETSKVIREVVEGLDLFVGRYLVLLATGYIGLKFLHFKIFPDFPPF